MKKILLGLFLLPFIVNSQEWMSNLPQEEKGNFSFQEVQQAFNAYIEDESIVNGKKQIDGQWVKVPNYKLYKRWEWYWETRVDQATGEFPDFSAVDAYYASKQPQRSKAEASNWTALGPDWSSGGYAGIGRVNTVAFPPGDFNNIYVGTPSGGLWYYNGASWTPLTDQNTVLGVSDIAFNSDFSTSNTMYIATGDRDGGSMWSLGGAQYNDNNSIGVLKSTDAGATWQSTGLSFDVSQNARMSRIIIDPNDDNILYAATSFGIYKTIDAGVTWAQVLSGAHIIDMEFKPFKSSYIYAASYNRSGNPEIFVSSDAGNSWTTLMSFPTNASRIELAVTPADSSYMYSLISNASGGFYGFYKSIDGGTTLESVAVTNSNTSFMGYYSDGSGENTGQGNYDLCMAASPNNVDEVFIGGINTWKSLDGGSSWTINNMWTSSSSYNFVAAPVVHADKHILKYRDDGVLFEGNDGGIYEAVEGGSSWTDFSDGLVISQLYRLGVSQTHYDITLAGLQDNGTKLLDETGWTDVWGGDGMECIIDYVDPNVQYNTYVRGEIHRTTDNWSSYTTISDNLPTTEVGHWVTPYIMDPNDNNTLYVGYHEVYKSSNRGDSFTQLTNFGDVNHKLRSIAMSPSNSNVLYVAFLDEIWKTQDGSTWLNITGSLPVSSNSITSIAVKNSDENTLWVSMGGYDSQRVYESNNGGDTWTNISTGLPNLPVMSVVQNNEVTNINQLYAGTDVGVFVKNGAENWLPFDNNLPNVVVTELEIYYNENFPDSSRLRAATYGRGLWESPLLTVSVQVPEVETYEAFNIGLDTATLQGNIVSDSGFTVTNSGFIYSTTPGGFMGDDGVATVITTPTVALGEFSAFVSGLTPSTTYYFKAFAENSEGIAYGDEKSFTTDCPPVTELPFNEEFSYGALPNCWRITDNIGNGQVWQFDNPSGYSFNSTTGSNGFAIVDSYNYGTGNEQNTALITPTFDFSALETVKLSFEQYFSNKDEMDEAAVMFSIDNGVIWDTVYQYDNADFGSFSSPMKENLDLSTLVAGHSQVKLKFFYRANYGNYWAIDDIKIFENEPLPENVLFDPALVDAATLPEGFEIVTEDTLTLLKVTLNGYSNNLPIDDYFTGEYNKFKFFARLDPGESGYSNNQLNLLVRPWGPDGAYPFTAGSSSTLVEYHGYASGVPRLLNALQFASQNTTDFNAVTGAVLYIGKITMYYEDPIPVTPQETATAYFTTSDVVIDAAYNSDEYESNSGGIINNVVLGSVNGVDAAENAEVGLNTDNYAEWFASFNDNYLYLVVDVRDEDRQTMPSTSTAPWLNDGIEFYIDAKNRRYINWPRIEGEQHVFRINLGKESPAIGGDGMPNFFGDNDTTNIQFSIGMNTLGYRIEVAIPWVTVFRTTANTNAEALNLAQTMVNEDLTLAFDLNLIDASAPDTRESIMCWSNNSGEDMNNFYNEFYGELNLGVNVNVISIYDIQFTGSVNGDSPYINKLVETQGVVTVVDDYGYYLQDGAGEWNGIYVYDTAAVVAVGDEVKVTGLVAEYNGLTEIKDITSTDILTSGNFLPEPALISVVDANTEGYESVLVALSKVKAGDGLTQYNEWFVWQSQNSLVVDDRLFFYEPVPYNYYNVTGVLSYAFGAFRLYPRSESDIVDLGAVPGNVYWFEDFDGSVWSSTVDADNLGYLYNNTTLPNNWSVVDNTGNSFYWHWSDVGPRGAYTQGDDGDWSTPANNLVEQMPQGATVDNGFMMLESDYFNTNTSGTIAETVVDMDAYVQVGPIDLSAAPSTIVSFKQLFRYCCYTSNTLSLFVSNDLTNWTEFSAKGEVNSNDNPGMELRNFKVNISPIAAGQSTVYLRFHKQGASHYFWMIDDIYIYEAPQNDLVLNDAWAHYGNIALPNEINSNPKYNFYGGYTSIPQSVLMPFVRFSAAIYNNGTNTQYNTTLGVSVYKDDAIIENFNTTAITFSPNQFDTVGVDASFIPEELGNYHMAYELAFNNNDQNPANNTWEYSFEVDKYTYSRVRRGEEYLFDDASPRDWSDGGYEGDFMGQIYDVPDNGKNTKLKGISVYIDDYRNYADGITAIEAGNFKMQAKVYKVDETFVDMNINSEMYTLQISDTATWVDLPFIDDGNLFVDPGMYLVGIEAYTGVTGQTNLQFRIGNDLTGTKQPKAGGIVHLTSPDNWVNSRENYAIDLYVNGIPGEGPELTLNVDMNNVADFTAGTDKVYIASSYYGWSEPGSDTGLMLNDFDGDNIYSGTFQVLPGTEFLYKYFINAGWENGEWASDPNRVIIMPENDIVINDVFGQYGTGNNIVSFTLTEQVQPATIDTINATVDVMVEQGTDLSNLTPNIEVSPGATITPGSGVARDFTSEVVYTVTSQNGMEKEWYVNVEEFTGESYNILFEVMHNQGYIFGAEIDLNGETKLTNRLGKAEFFDYAPAEDIPYTISRMGYTKQSGTVTITNNNLDVQVYLFPLDIEDEPNEEIAIYPNPSGEEFYINSINNQEMSDIKIFNLSGQIIYANTHPEVMNTIKLNSQSPGVYIVQVVMGEEVIQMKHVLK